MDPLGNRGRSLCPQDTTPAPFQPEGAGCRSGAAETGRTQEPSPASKDGGKIGCVILAAGNGARFGENKLLAPFRGQPLVAWALAAAPRGCETVVVTQYDAVEALARAAGFGVVRNEHPDWGISHSVALGTAALASCEGILYQVADQPLLRQATTQALVSAFRANPDRILVPTAQGRSGNPCLFPRDLFPALRALQGDRGGRQVIRRCPDRVMPLEVDPAELRDVDTAEALASLNP